MYEYYYSHYHRGYGGEPGRASSRLLDNMPGSTRVVQGLPGPDCSGQNHRGRPHHAGVIASEVAGGGARFSLDDAVESEGDDPFGSLGEAAGPTSPPGRTLVPFYIGETITQTSPTSFAFSRCGREFPETPQSDSEADCIERRSSSTTTFSEEDFQISYQKVMESVGSSWLGDGEEESFGGSGSRLTDRIPSVELSSVRATHKTQSEQLSSRGGQSAVVGDVSVQRPRSEDLSIRTRDRLTSSGTLGRNLEPSVVARSNALRNASRPEATESDDVRPRGGGRRPFPSPHVTFGGSSPGLPVKATKLAAEALKEERGRDLQPSSLPQVRQKSPPPLAAQSLPKPPMQPPPASRVPVVEEPPRGAVGGKATPSSTKSWTPQGVKDTSPSPSPDRLTPGGTPVQLLSGTPVGTPAGATVVRKESRISRSRSRSPRPTSAFRQVRTAQTEDGRRSPKRCPSPPRLATSRDLVSACSDEIATAEYALAIVGAQHTTPPAPPLGPEGERFHDKAVQVHIRQLDRRLIACSILAGVLAVALVAVVLFALLAK